MNKTLLSMLALVAAVATVAPAAAQDAKPGDQKAGEIKAAMCIGCHNIPGYQASFPEIYKVPKIAGPEREVHRRRRSPPTARATASTRRCARSRSR